MVANTDGKPVDSAQFSQPAASAQPALLGPPPPAPPPQGGGKGQGKGMSQGQKGGGSNWNSGEQNRFWNPPGKGHVFHPGGTWDENSIWPPPKSLDDWQWQQAQGKGKGKGSGKGKGFNSFNGPKPRPKEPQFAIPTEPNPGVWTDEGNWNKGNCVECQKRGRDYKHSWEECQFRKDKGPAKGTTKITEV